MKQLSNKVSIVPVIAKADCLTQKEISDLKKTILKEIRDNGIKVYTLPDCDRYVWDLPMEQIIYKCHIDKEWMKWKWCYIVKNLF